MLTKTQIKVILILMDDKGHPEWDIAETINMERSNLHKLLKELDSIGVIKQGEKRDTTRDRRRAVTPSIKWISTEKRKKAKQGKYQEVPYFLPKNLENLRIIIRELAKASRLFETFFILESFENSEYIKTMKVLYGEEVNEIVESEIHATYPPYSDPFFANIIAPQLVESPWHCIETPESFLFQLECFAITLGIKLTLPPRDNTE